MEPSTKGNGETTKLMVEVNSGTQTGMSMKVNGKMTRPTGTEFTSMSTEPSTRAIGKMICKTDKAWSLGATAQSMREATRKA